MAEIGYVRVSTHDQDVALQADALRGTSVDRLFENIGVSRRFPGSRPRLPNLRAGDILVVWKLDRLGRSMRHLLDTVTGLDTREIGFHSLKESIDTTTTGRRVFHIFGTLGQFERDIIRERTQVGIKAARARGRQGGRPKAITPAMIGQAHGLITQGLTVREAAARLRIGKSTLYATLAAERSPPRRGNGIRTGLAFRERFFRWPQPVDIARFPASRNFFPYPPDKPPPIPLLSSGKCGSRAMDPRITALKSTIFSGPRLTRRQIADVQETVELLPNDSRHAPAKTICEHLNWKTAKGSYRVGACLGMLGTLEGHDILRRENSVRDVKAADRPAWTSASDA